MTISVGGEIGEVGKENSTVAELRAYLDGYRRELDARAPGADRDQQGQRPDRDLARRRAAAGRRRRARSSSTSRSSRELGEIARALRPGRRRPARRLDPARRAVPPLPGGRDGRDPPRDGLPERALRASRRSPSRSTRDRGTGASPNAIDERKPDQTDQQFVYTTRKKAIGPFKRQLWDLATKDEILAAQRRKIAFLFTRARRQRVARDGRPATSTPVELHRPLPDALREAVAAG